MSYSLGVQGKGIESVRDLSEKEYENIRKSLNCLFDFSRDQQLYAIVLLNYDDFSRTMKNCFQRFVENKGGMNFVLMERMVLNINKCLLNFLFSIRTLLDHTQTKLVRTYGDKSIRFKTFKEACANAYDNSFSYRFLAKLRNYSQHCGMPVGILTLGSKEDPPYSGRISYSMEVKFKRDELLEFDLWGSRIAKEISQLPSEFDIVPHVVETMKYVQGIVKASVKKDFQEISDSADLIEKLANEVHEKEGIPCILRFPEIKRGMDGKVKEMKIEITHFPFHTVEIIKNLRN